MNLDSHGRRGLALQPVGFPLGRYDGERSLHEESPDPLAFCRNRPEHPSAPITFQVPMEVPITGERQLRFIDFPWPEVLSVRVERDGHVQHGCARVSLGTPQEDVAFIAEGALKRDAEYEVKVRWRVNHDAPVRTFAWSFRPD